MPKQPFDIAKFRTPETISSSVLNAMPFGVMVVDEQARPHAMNDVIKQTFGITEEATLNSGLGDLLGCLNALEGPEGCGTAQACSSCKARELVRSALAKGTMQTTTARFQLQSGGRTRSVTVCLTAVPMAHYSRNLVILMLNDITEIAPSAVVKSVETDFHGMIGRHATILNIFEDLRAFAKSDAPVCIQGESGTGKELAALAIHKESRRANEHFVPFNCGAVPEGLVESELFGHVKGAFTNAHKTKKGRFELAHRGTLFLDEVGELKPAVQVKLLRVLQEGVLERVGDATPLKVDVRIISATNRNLVEEVKAGRFREDLYYRLCVVPIHLPPLRERGNDTELLIGRFLERYAKEMGMAVPSLSTEVLDELINYDWPGNIRELQNILQYACVKSRGEEIRYDHLPPALQHFQPAQAGGDEQVPAAPAANGNGLSKSAVMNALDATDGNKRAAAKLLGVSRSTFYRFITKKLPSLIR